jgi:PAS domain-containing protein
MESAASIPQEPLTRDPEDIPTSEVKLRQVVDMIPALVRFWSNLADSPNDFSNQGWRDYTGISSEEARGRGWQAAVHPDDLPKLLETWREMVAAGKAGVLRRGFAATTACSGGFSVGSTRCETSRERFLGGSEQRPTLMP